MQGDLSSYITCYSTFSQPKYIHVYSTKFKQKQHMKATCFLLRRPHGRRVIAGAAHIAPYNLLSSACLLVICLRTSQSLNLAEPGIPPLKPFRTRKPLLQITWPDQTTKATVVFQIKFTVLTSNQTPCYNPKENKIFSIFQLNPVVEYIFFLYLTFTLVCIPIFTGTIINQLNHTFY
jgi:hypothetical protein